jgi:hypothetical protein
VTGLRPSTISGPTAQIFARDVSENHLSGAFRDEWVITKWYEWPIDPCCFSVHTEVGASRRNGQSESPAITDLRETHGSWQRIRKGKPLVKEGRKTTGLSESAGSPKWGS